MTPPTPSSTDVLLRLLTDPDRRRLVSRLAETDGPTPTARLVRSTSRSERSAPRREWRIRLYHVHLPALRDAGVVAYDSRAGPIERGAAFEDAVTLLGLFAERCESEA